MSSEAPSAHLADDRTEAADATFSKDLPTPTQRIPCDGYWQPHCKSEEPRFLKKGQATPVCRAGHRHEAWSLQKPVNGPYKP